MREVAAQFERPVLLFSGGKDSIVMVHLAQKAFWPGRFPFPLLHIDTGHNFPETMEFRDWLAEEPGCELLVRTVQDSIDQGASGRRAGPNPSRNALQTVTLLDALRELKVDAAFGGGRRDEEKARAKERFFSHRDPFGQWDPKNQRPELWNLFNGRKALGRALPRLPALQLDRDGRLAVHRRRRASPCPASTSRTSARSWSGTACCWPSARTTASPRARGQVSAGALPHHRRHHLHGRVGERRDALEEIIQEVAAARVTERGGRSDDKRSEAAMEDRKRQGYF